MRALRSEGGARCVSVDVGSGRQCQVDKQAERRVAVLTDLFNVLPDARIRLRLLLDTLAYTKKAGLAGLVAPTVKVAPPQWHLHAKGQRACTGALRV